MHQRCKEDAHDDHQGTVFKFQLADLVEEGGGDRHLIFFDDSPLECSIFALTD